MKLHNFFRNILIKLRSLRDRQKEERKQLDLIFKKHEEFKEQQRNSPTGFEATEIERHRRSGGIG